MSMIGDKHKHAVSGVDALVSVENGTERILAGIAADAAREAASIIAETEKVAAERIAFARQKAEGVRTEAVKKAEEQAAQIKQTVLSSLKIALKREKMRTQDGLLQEIMAHVHRKLAAAVTAPEYRSTLVNWIVEAATGLGASSAVVNASAAERTLIDDRMLHEVKVRASSLLHTSVDLTIASEAPLVEQGIVVTAADGRTAFNNQVATRIRRMEQQIRNRVYDALFADKTRSDRSNRESEQS
ncbi:MAG: hypothetical protein JW913_16480 [Chitinispirillaceae bacterium]|nr:hypothetical protein [Chitinispirillaceae bacterium]